MPVPFFNAVESFQHQWSEISEQLDRISDFTDSCTVREFEQTIENNTGAKHAIGVGCGTDALILMLRAAGIAPGDEVLVPCFTFIASVSSIAHVGAKPVFVDIDPITYNIDPAHIEARITRKTRAIMPVHLFTQPAEMPAINRIAAARNLMILEDSAEGIGMWCDGIHTGCIGQAGIFSFTPTKTLGALGDAGMVVTNNADIAYKCRLLRDHGREESSPYTYHMVGYNSKMDAIQAAILQVRSRYLARDIAKRAALADFYNRRLEKLKPQVLPPTIPMRGYTISPVYYVYLIQVVHRNELGAYLSAQGIGNATFFSTPLHLQPCFAHFGHRPGDFPNTEHVCASTLALPLYPDLSLSQTEEVCQTIENFYQQRR